MGFSIVSRLAGRSRKIVLASSETIHSCCCSPPRGNDEHRVLRALFFPLLIANLVGTGLEYAVLFVLYFITTFFSTYFSAALVYGRTRRFTVANPVSLTA